MTTGNLQTDNGKPEPATGRAGAMDEIREAMNNCRELLKCNVVDFENMSTVCITDLFTIARWLVANAGELVRVKPLGWVDSSDGLQARSKSPLGNIYVIASNSLLLSSTGWYVSFMGGHHYACDSLADGKAKAEVWYRDRLAAALEPLFPTEAHHADN